MARCRESTEAGSNLLKLRVTEGFFWRSEMPSVTVIGRFGSPTSARSATFGLPTHSKTLSLGCCFREAKQEHGSANNR
jgi:hypothetical protein